MVPDFWRMLVEQGCHTVVMLNRLEEQVSVPSIFIFRYAEKPLFLLALRSGFETRSQDIIFMVCVSFDK